MSLPYPRELTAGRFQRACNRISRLSASTGPRTLCARTIAETISSLHTFAPSTWPPVGKWSRWRSRTVGGFPEVSTAEYE
jgi:hypothetical protein